ncbi:MAG: alpha/beta fold hydrolase [Bacteroidia bacterium]|nr:alpha/beta fold hydrolase [Bacteroidia bacterium]
MKAYNNNLYPFEGKRVNINGNNIHYIDEGQGEIILFSHPPLGSSFMYRDFIKVLRKNYRCIALDYPNFGLSIAGPDYSLGIEAQSIILEKFIIKLNLSNIYVLGHDTGGPSAFGAAIRRPNLFRGIILTDTIIYPVSEYKKLASMLKIVGGQFFTWLNAHTNFLVNGTFKNGVRTRKLTKAERAEYKRMFNTPHKRRRITQMLFNLKQSEKFMKMIKRGFETTLNTKPALLIYGENDPVKKLGIADRIHALLPNSEYFLIDKEGHFPHEGQPRQMSKIIHHWIEKTELNATNA